MSVRMIATAKHPKAAAGTEIEVSNSCIRFFREHGWAVPADDAAAATTARTAPAEPADDAGQDEETAPAAEATEDEPMPDIDALRAAYLEATGSRPNPNWKAETLARKIEEARAAGSYQRRDMRAED